MNDKIKVSVFGYGRFGRLFSEIISNFVQVLVHDPHINSTDNPKIKFVTLKDALTSPVLVYAIPIENFEAALSEHINLLKEEKSEKLFIDLLSVKVHPKRLFQKKLPPNFQALLIHPMFGPDSVKLKGLVGQKIVVDSSLTKKETADFWCNLFERVGLEIVYLDAEDHDRYAASSQGLAHFIGRVLEDFSLVETPIDTLGAKLLQQLKEQTCNDSWQLFSGLQRKNPYTIEMRKKLGLSLNRIYSRLLPERLEEEKMIVGIQGGIGSFNEKAINKYLIENGINEFEIKYLYTTRSVLTALSEGEIDFGQFAIHNTIGGVVDESLEAMAEFNFNIKSRYELPITHALMIRSDVDLSTIDTIMTHPQVLKQCHNNLKINFPNIKLTNGEGELLDSAKAAAALANGELPKNVAVMGNIDLAKNYSFTVVKDQMQDSQDNKTTFLLVERPFYS